MSITKFAINIAIKNPKIETLDDFLFIGPHPDDIEIGAGATISKLVKLGKKVSFLICTDGRYGKENIQEDILTSELIKIRHDECLASANFLGVKNVHFLNLSDGNQYEYKSLLNKMAEVINEIKPKVIFAPDPDIISECHQDHLNVGRAAKELAVFANFPEIFANYLPEKVEISNLNIEAICLYFTNKPNKYVRTYGHFKKQLEAIYHHKSQFPQNHPATKSLVLYLKLRAVDFGFRKLSIPCEGFRMINKTRMHCLPEAER